MCYELWVHTLHSACTHFIHKKLYAYTQHIHVNAFELVIYWRRRLRRSRRQQQHENVFPFHANVKYQTDIGLTCQYCNKAHTLSKYLWKFLFNGLCFILKIGMWNGGCIKVWVRVEKRKRLFHRIAWKLRNHKHVALFILSTTHPWCMAKMLMQQVPTNRNIVY